MVSCESYQNHFEDQEAGRPGRRADAGKLFARSAERASGLHADSVPVPVPVVRIHYDGTVNTEAHRDCCGEIGEIGT